MSKLIILAVLILAPLNVLSAVRTWDGGGADSNWATPANWVGDVAPVSGDDLVFPATSAQFSTINNVFPTTFSSVTFEGGSYSVGGNSLELTNGLTVNGGSHTLNSVSIRRSQTFAAAQGSTVTIINFVSFGSLVNSYVLRLNGTGSFGFGIIFGVFNVEKNDLGASLIAAGANYTGVITLNDGVLIIDANIPNSIVNINGGSAGGTFGFSGFAGTGTVGMTNVNAGVISSGTLTSPTGILNIRNSLNFTANGNYICKIAGTIPGANGHDQINVVGTVSINNAGLAPLPWNGFRPAIGNTFVILKNDGTDAINGIFRNAPEGSVFAGPLNTAFRITYLGGDGNDVAVMRVPRALFDFDGDGKSDISAYAGGQWYVNQSSTSQTRITGFGVDADLIAPGDFDGDNRTDVAVFRPSNGVWYIVNSATSTVSFIPFGQSGDLPLPNDFDGDGRADITVFRPSNGAWYEMRSLSGQVLIQQFGFDGDKPLMADYDGDGIGDLAVYRPSTGVWHFLQSSSGTYTAFLFGISTDLPVPADYDGDGKTDAAVFRATADGSQPDFYILRSSDLSVRYASWGFPGDIPAVADYDGDGRSDIGVVRPGISQNPATWYLLQTTDGYRSLEFTNSTRAVPAAYTR